MVFHEPVSPFHGGLILCKSVEKEVLFISF